MNPSFEQTLVEVWRQSLVENAKTVELIFPSSDFLIGPFPSGRPRVILTSWFTCEAFRSAVRLSLPGFFMNLYSFPCFMSQLRNSIKWSWSISSTKRRVVHFSNCRSACLCDFNVSRSNVTSMLCSRLSIASAIVIRSAFFFRGSGRSKPSAASSRCRPFALAAFTAASKFPLTLSRFLPPSVHTK